MSDHHNTSSLHLSILMITVMTVAAVIFAVVPPRAVNAAVLRPSGTALVCSTNTISAGSSTHCTVTVRDTEVGKGQPLGEVTFTSSPAPVYVFGPACTLTALTNNATSCSADLLFINPGKQALVAVYTPTDGIHSGSTSVGGFVSTTLTGKAISVAPASSPVTVTTMADTTSIVTPTDTEVLGAGCVSGGRPGYWGEFVSFNGDLDPLTSPSTKIWEQTANADGSSEHLFSMGSGINTVSHWRWYCASSSPTSLTDPSIISMTPNHTTTIQIP